MRRLIINADDFGLTSGVNRAIIEANQKGLVTSATLMANSQAFDEAVALAKSNSSLGVGCHVVLVDGAPVSPPDRVPSLLGDGTRHFRHKLYSFTHAASRRQLDPSQIEMEVVAQIQKIQAAGIQVTHLDSHKHTHMFRAVTAPFLSAAKTCGVPAIRNPFEFAEFTYYKDRPALWKRYFQVRTLRLLARKFRMQVEAAGLRTTDGSVGIIATGSLDQILFEQIVQSLPDGTWELVCHPGYNDEQLQKAGTRLLASRVQELELLTSTEGRALLQSLNIELMSFRGLV